MIQNKTITYIYLKKNYWTVFGLSLLNKCGIFVSLFLLICTGLQSVWASGGAGVRGVSQCRSREGSHVDREAIWNLGWHQLPGDGSTSYK